MTLPILMRRIPTDPKSFDRAAREEWMIDSNKDSLGRLFTCTIADDIAGDRNLGYIFGCLSFVRSTPQMTLICKISVRSAELKRPHYVSKYSI